MARGLRREEKAGLLVALALHVALVIALLLQPDAREAIPPAERMTVNLATEVGLEATAPDPVPQSRAAIAPTLSDTPAPEVAEPLPRPVERPVTRVRSPIPQPTARPREQADTRPRRRPDPPRTQERPRPSERSGGSRIGSDFLEGSGDSADTAETRTPASQIGANTKASLFQAVGRQLRPHWRPPSGPDVEKIVTKIRFRLNPDGSLAGGASVVGQSGVNAINKTQADRHAEQAVRAVQLAAPFDLPEEYYEAWKLITVDFDWKLSQ